MHSIAPNTDSSPATQSMHVDSLDAPTVVEYVPATQSMHVDSLDAPTVVEYVPAAQSVFVVPSQYDPAGH